MSKKQKIISGLLFILILIFILVGIDSILHMGLRLQSGSCLGVWNKVADGKINAEVIIIGASRALVHYDCRIIQKIYGKSCYNLGINATEVLLQKPMLSMYLKYNRKPEVIIKSLGITSLTKKKKIPDPYLYTPYLKEKELYSTLTGLDPNFWKHKYLPLYSFAKLDRKVMLINSLKALLNMNQFEDRIMGYSPENKSWTDEFDQFKKLYPNGMNYKISKDSIDALEQIISFAKESGIKIVLVYAPEYVEIFPYILNRNEIIGIYRRLAKKYNVPLWDYSNHSMSKVKDYFYNTQHLNIVGAEKFSNILSKDLKKLSM